jgi:hypothetical protein
MTIMFIDLRHSGFELHHENLSLSQSTIYRVFSGCVTGVPVTQPEKIILM